MKTASEILKNRYRRWRLTKINTGYKMTRVEDNGVSYRNLTLWEKIIYFWQTK